jgi:hypothetical protein
VTKRERFAGGLEIKQDIDMDAMLGKLAGEMKLKGIETGLQHVGQMVIAEAQQRVPRSALTGTKKKWSKSYRQRYRKSTPLHTQFILKPKEYKMGKVLAVVVRVKYPQGAHGHLVEYGHRSVLWGRRTGSMVQGKRFMLPAIEATRSRADAAFKQGLEAAIVGAGG